MPEQETEQEHKTQLVANIKQFSTIANSCSDCNIYTYGANIESNDDLKRPGFFNPAVSFLAVGDVVRVFKYEKKELVKYYEFVVVKIDEPNKVVTVAIIKENNLAKVTIE